jgi:hypothetical protein
VECSLATAVCEVGVCTVSACHSHSGGGRLAPTHPAVPAAVSASQPCSGGRAAAAAAVAEGASCTCTALAARIQPARPASTTAGVPCALAGVHNNSAPQSRQGAAHGVRCVFAVCRPSSATAHFWRRLSRSPPAITGRTAVDPMVFARLGGCCGDWMQAWQPEQSIEGGAGPHRMPNRNCSGQRATVARSMAPQQAALLSLFSHAIIEFEACSTL